MRCRNGGHGAGATAERHPVTRLDPALDSLIAPDAKLELVKGGFGFTEGALWVPRGDSGYLLFSDIPANVIYMWDPIEEKISVYFDHSGYTGQDISAGRFHANQTARKRAILITRNFP